MLAFTRHTDEETLLVAFNLSDVATTVVLPLHGSAQVLHGHGLHEGSLDGRQLHLPGHGAVFASLENANRQQPARQAALAGATP